MIELAIASVLKEVNNEKAPLFRIIFTDDSFIYCIDLTPPHKMPYKRRREDIQELLDNGFLDFADDPFFRIKGEENIKDRDKITRDKKLEYVLYVFNIHKQRFLMKNQRKALFEEAAKKFSVDVVSVRRAVSRYLQHGMNDSALLPDYDNIGGKGKEKPDTANKLGRPRVKFSEGVQGPGINVTSEVKKQINGIMVFYKNKSQPSFADAYDKFLEKHYSNHYYENGKRKAKVWNEDIIISYRQFRYQAKKILGTNKSDTLIKRLGKNEFNKKFRALLGDKTKEAFGPGSKFQIDATHVNVFCCSSENSDCYVGKPILYSIIDVMSRYIPAIYVGLENPSWTGAAMAINNLGEDKVGFCARYGIDITPDMWPSSLLPEILFADNGEFAGDKALLLTANLGIEIQNAQSYRGDCKAIVERSFGVTKKGLTSLPGASIKKMHERGDIDVRHDAIMTVDEVIGEILRDIIYHNITVMDNYDKGDFAIRDPIRLTPVDIWNWGIKNRSCGFIYRDPNILKLATMPRSTAKITREGIRFEKRFYSCKEAIEGEWFVNPIDTSISIAHDPRTMQYIYLPSDDGRSFITCKLLEKGSFYENMHYDDYIALDKYNTVEKSALEHEKQQARVDKLVAREQAVKNAKQRKKEHGPSATTKTYKLRNLKANRNAERDERRNDEAVILDNGVVEHESRVLSFKLQRNDVDDSKRFENGFYDHLRTLEDDKNNE